MKKGEVCMLILSSGQAAILERSEIDYMLDRMTAIRERAGNPMGIEIQAFGGATAFYSKAMPWPQFNTVKGISGEELPMLDDILAFYQERSGTCQLEIIPSKTSKPLLKALHNKGWYQSDFHATLYGEPSPVSSKHGFVTVRELHKDEIDLYAEIHCLGTGLPLNGKGHVADNNAVLMGRQGWHFYVALVDGAPAGVGVMYVQGDVASLTFATTLPEYRNQGVQAALLHKRKIEAERYGCNLVVSQAAYASSSFRNMERAGLRLAYTRATWTRA